MGDFRRHFAPRGDWRFLTADEALQAQLGEEQLEVGSKALYVGREKAIKHSVEAGMRIYRPTTAEVGQWEAAIQPLEEKWVSDREKEGIKVAGKFLERYKELAAEAAR